jgi:hypothetical protein
VLTRFFNSALLFIYVVGWLFAPANIFATARQECLRILFVCAGKPENVVVTANYLLMKKRAKYTDAWFRFMEDLERAKSSLKFQNNEECFFRGHNQETHNLRPGLFRGINDSIDEIPDEIWEAEYSMFYEFRARAKEVHQGNLTDWDILFYMQHHGCKTRLLDWTENFGVALYFALMGKRDADFSPTIWMMNPYTLNEECHDNRDLYSPEFLDHWDDDEEENISYSDIITQDYYFWWDKPVALYPIRRVDRLTTQGGYFTIHGNDIRPLETILGADQNILKKIVIPKDAITDAEDFLAMAGINEFTMFPDLDGLAQYLNRKYFNYKP